MLVTVGRILRPHGLRGEVVVEVRTDEPQRRYAAGAALVVEPAGAPARPAGGGPAAGDGGWRPPPSLTVAAARSHQGRLIVSFDGVADRDAAEALRGLLLRVDNAGDDPPDDPDEFGDHQLIGLAAVSVAGERLGEVAGIDHAPAADLLVLRRPDGRTALVPFVRAIVPDVDLAGGRVVVDPPPGLLDL